jgi:hypothetical protein
MPFRLKLRALLAAAAFALAAPGTNTAHAQQPAPLQQPTHKTEARRKALSYTFVSPNTRENLTLAEAVRMLNSPEELKLVKDIRRLSVCLGLKPAVTKAVGSWTDGAEHSTMFRVFTDQPTIRYADARLGKLERQKSVLNFRRDAAGGGRMYVLYAVRGRLSLASISRTLDRHGVAFRTLVPVRRRRTIVYVVDLNGELRRKVRSAAGQLGARLAQVKGTGEFIGDDADRDKAGEVFSGIIKQYEEERPEVARKCAKP